MSDFLKSVLPTGITPGNHRNPRVMILYGGYKIGKSALAAWLSREKQALWLDYEGGSDAQDRVCVDVIKAAEQAGMKKLDFLEKLWLDLSKQSPPAYHYLIHDKLDNLEDWAERKATAYYKSTVIGRNFTGKTVLELDKGGGYLHLREQFKEIWTAALRAAPVTIFLASLRDRQIEKTDNAVSSNDLDLTGKVRKIAVGFADTVGLIYREVDGSNWVSFVTSEKGTFAGSRIPRLENQRFKLSWMERDALSGEQVLRVAWDRIFLP